MTARIAMPSDRIAAFCKRWRVAELALCGSVVRDDFGPDSDVDVLVSFDPGARRTLRSASSCFASPWGASGRSTWEPSARSRQLRPPQRSESPWA